MVRFIGGGNLEKTYYLPQVTDKLEFLTYNSCIGVHLTMNRIGGVMVSVLALSAVDRGFKPGWVKPKTIKLVFVASPLSTQH